MLHEVSNLPHLHLAELELANSLNQEPPPCMGHVAICIEEWKHRLKCWLAISKEKASHSRLVSTPTWVPQERWQSLALGRRQQSSSVPQDLDLMGAAEPAQGPLATASTAAAPPPATDGALAAADLGSPLGPPLGAADAGEGEPSSGVGSREQATLLDGPRRGHAQDSEGGSTAGLLPDAVAAAGGGKTGRGRKGSPSPVRRRPGIPAQPLGTGLEDAGAAVAPSGKSMTG